jgi:hypothetical protein
MNEFSQEDHLRLAMKSCSDGHTTPEDSGIRTASYVSELSINNNDSSSDATNTIQLKDQNDPIENKKRYIKDIAKHHARDIIAYKVNKKLADQAALAAA